MKKLLAFFVIALTPFFCLSQINIDDKYEVSLQALEYLRNNNVDEFSKLIDNSILKDVNKQVMKTYVSQASQILTKYKNPRKEFVILSQSQTNYQGKRISILGLSFPFPPPIKPGLIADQHIVLLFSDDFEKNKIVGWKIRDFAGPAREKEEAAKSIPHLKKFDFEIDNLTWIRIWYDRGPAENKFGNASGVYALSGGLTILEKAQIKNLVSEIFDLINSAKIDSTDYKYSLRKTIGDPEDLYIRMTLSNYSELDEFSIFAVITPEENVDEISDGFIVIKHSDVFRYFLKIDSNKELFEKIVELAHKNHGDLLEKNP